MSAGTLAMETALGLLVHGSALVVAHSSLVRDET